MLRLLRKGGEVLPLASCLRGLLMPTSAVPVVATPALQNEELAEMCALH